MRIMGPESTTQSALEVVGYGMIDRYCHESRDPEASSTTLPQGVVSAAEFYISLTFQPRSNLV